jgi:hypothetical protein
MVMRTKKQRHQMHHVSEIYITNGKRLAGSFVTGLATLVAITDPAPKNFLGRSSTTNRALRGDFERIGADMFKAVKNEKNREKAAS